MSPWWRDRIEVFLAPDRRRSARTSHRGLQPAAGAGAFQCRARRDRTPTGGPRSTCSDARSTRSRGENADARGHRVGSLRALRAGAVERRGGGRRRAPGARAASPCGSIYGERAEGWDGGAGRAAGRAAIDRGRHRPRARRSAARHASPPREIALRAVRPFLVAAHSTAPRGCLAPGPAGSRLEPGRVCVAHLDGARWLALRTPAGERNPLESALPRVLKQKSAAGRLEADATEVCLVARDRRRAELVRAGWMTAALATPRWRAARLRTAQREGEPHEEPACTSTSCGRAGARTWLGAGLLAGGDRGASAAALLEYRHARREVVALEARSTTRSACRGAICRACVRPRVDPKALADEVRKANVVLAQLNDSLGRAVPRDRSRRRRPRRAALDPARCGAAAPCASRARRAAARTCSPTWRGWRQRDALANVFLTSHEMQAQGSAQRRSRSAARAVGGGAGKQEAGTENVTAMAD